MTFAPLFLTSQVVSASYRILITGVMAYYLFKRIRAGQEIAPVKPRYRR